tara:strand:+ start:150 stop:539 length:390 start_codon:yes stop_codon:yes gene_type:complete
MTDEDAARLQLYLRDIKKRLSKIEAIMEAESIQEDGLTNLIAEAVADIKNLLQEENLPERINAPEIIHLFSRLSENLEKIAQEIIDKSLNKLNHDMGYIKHSWVFIFKFIDHRRPQQYRANPSGIKIVK